MCNILFTCNIVLCYVTLYGALARDGHSVLVHGSEGTDATLLVSSLAQLILDPNTRTLAGFLGLLEREWLLVRPLK